MGTYYSIQASPLGRDGQACLADTRAVSRVLDTVNLSMSTYLSDSEITLFNKSMGGTSVEVSQALIDVVTVAAQMWQRSGGAFDATVGPLVNLWGFGAGTSAAEVDAQQAPTQEAQVRARNKVGMEKLSIVGHNLTKSIDDLYVDLSALAKGYGVDQLSDLLITNHCQDFMVDIGGEIRVSGQSAKGEHWQIGIEVPDPSQLGTLQAILRLSDLSIATSGDYRNYRIINGLRVDHVIDPRSGGHASSNVVSTTVLHPSAMWADAYATTLMVLDMQAGLDFANQEGIPAYIVVRHTNSDGEQNLEARYNSAMQTYLLDATNDPKL